MRGPHSVEPWGVVGSQPSEPPWYNLELAPVLRGSRERPKKEADHPRLVGGNFNKQRALNK